MDSRWIVVVLVLIALVGVSGCAKKTTEAQEPTGALDSLLEPQDVGEEGGAGMEGEVPDGVLRRVMEVVTGELGVSAAEVHVVESEYVEWSDTSLGCPQPGMLYAQVITPGYRVVVSVGGKQYEVHTDARGKQAVLCVRAHGDGPLSGGGEP